MNIIRNEGTPPTDRLGDMNSGEVIYRMGDAETLYTVGESGEGTRTGMRHLTDLTDGGVLCESHDKLVVKVRGSFVCAR